MGLVQVGPACVLQLSTSDKRNQNLDWYTPENMRGERLQMTAWHNSNEMMRGKGEFFHLEDRESNHPFIEKESVAMPYRPCGYVSLSCSQQF
jgi:hypothetical protein